jgi:hypothetical protein
LSTLGGEAQEEGLGRRRDLALGVAGRDGMVFDGEQRLARAAIQDEDEALLGRPDKGRHYPAVALQIHEGRRGGGLVVPDVLANVLEAPGDLSRLDVHRRDGCCERHAFQTVAAPVVRLGRGNGHIDEAQLGVRGHGGPDVGRSGDGDQLLGDEARVPQKLARARVHGHQVAGRRHRIGPVLARPSEQDRVADHRWRLEEREGEDGVHVVPLVDVQHPALAELLAKLARVGVHGVEMGVHGSDQEALLAGAVLPAFPVGHAPVLESGLGQRLQGGLGVVGPALLPCGGVEREDAVEGRAEVERAVGVDRGRGPDRRR